MGGECPGTVSQWAVSVRALYRRTDLLGGRRPAPPAETEVLQTETEGGSAALERQRPRPVQQSAPETALQLTHRLAGQRRSGGTAQLTVQSKNKQQTVSETQGKSIPTVKYYAETRFRHRSVFIDTRTECGEPVTTGKTRQEFFFASIKKILIPHVWAVRRRQKTDVITDLRFSPLDLH